MIRKKKESSGVQVLKTLACAEVCALQVPSSLNTDFRLNCDENKVLILVLIVLKNRLVSLC